MELHFWGTIYLLTLCIILLAADGVGPRNVVGSRLLKLLIFIFFCGERDSLAKFIFACRSRFAEIRAPVRGLRRPCPFHKKKRSSILELLSFLRRERDSNPRSLSAQRFSRPPQSTTLPSLLEIGCKSTAFFSNTQIFCKNSCQYAKNIVILHPK